LAFKIRVVPIVNHHRIKAGLAAVVLIPAIKASLDAPMRFVSVLFLFKNVCNPIMIINAPPIRPTDVWTIVGRVNSLRIKKIRNINGNSTMPCPKAIRAPAVFVFEDFSIVTANKGPGSNTPERDMKATDTRNSGKSVVNVMAFSGSHGVKA
jgi:hypothetical protein